MSGSQLGWLPLDRAIVHNNQSPDAYLEVEQDVGIHAIKDISIATIQDVGLFHYLPENHFLAIFSTHR